MDGRFEVWRTDDRGERTERRAAFATRREAEAYILSRGGQEPLVIRDHGAAIVRPSPISVGRRPIIERNDSVRPDPRRPSRPRQPAVTPAPLSSRPSPPSRPRMPRQDSGVRRRPRESEPRVGFKDRPSQPPKPASYPPPTPPPASQPRPCLSGPSPDLLEERGRIRKLMMRGHHDDAAAAMQGRPLDAELELYRAWINFDDEDDEADSAPLAALAAAALRADRLLGFGYYVLGRIAEREGRLDDAARAFKRAAQLSPEHRDARRREQRVRRGRGA